MADMDQFWPILAGSARIETDSARIELRRHESEKKKKKRRRGTDARSIASNAASRVAPRRTRVRHPPSRVRAF